MKDDGGFLALYIVPSLLSFAELNPSTVFDANTESVLVSWRIETPTHAALDLAPLCIVSFPLLISASSLYEAFVSHYLFRTQ